MPQSFRFASAALLILSSASAAADPLPSAVRADAWNRFVAVAGANAAVRWSPVDGVPVSVRAVSGSALPGFSSDRAGAVRSLFLDHAELFRLRPGLDDFHVIGERESRGVHHLRMAQTWRGIPVRGGQYMVSVGSDGRLRMIGGRSIPGVDADVTPAVGERRAIDAAAASLQLPSIGEAVASLAIEPADRARDRLVWQVVLGAPKRTGEWEVLVDARDGSIIASRSRAFGAAGCAAIYDPSPLVPLREDDFAISEPADTVAGLQGPNVRVLHETAPLASADSLSEACWDFHFDPVTQPESFDQANVYWQVDHFIREFHGGNGFPGFPQPMTVILRPFRCGEANTGETIAHTVWLTSEGCGYKSSTRDADIIDHETQHVVNNFFGLEGGLDLDREIYATALHESFANYFACAAQNDPIYGDYFFGPAGFANCNSDPAEYNYARRREIGIGTLQNYLVGMIWSGALWDIRTRIGPIIDRIALESLYYLPAQPSFHNAVDAIFQANHDLHEGRYETEMAVAFAARGLGPGVPHASIVGPSQLAFGVPGTWTADVCCGVPPYRLQWTRILDGTTARESLGTAASVTVASDRYFDLKLRVVDGVEHAVEVSRRVAIVITDPLLSVQIEGPREVLAGIPNRWTAQVSGQGQENVTYRWTLTDGPVPLLLGDSASVTTSLARSSTLNVLIGAGPRGSVSAFIRVETDAVPEPSISGPLVLFPGEEGLLEAWVTGGRPPYAVRWTRDGLGPENLIGTGPSVTVVGDTVAHTYSVTATTALGLVSLPASRTITPIQSLGLAINGPGEMDPGATERWSVTFEGRPIPSTATYRWTSRCVGPDCAPDTIGNQRFVTVTSFGNFELESIVRVGSVTGSATRRIHVRGVPTVTVVAPEWVAPGEPVTLSARVSGGQGPYTYRWTRDGPAGPVLGTDAKIDVRGDGRDYVVDLEVLSADGLVADGVRHTMQSGLGPRPTPTQPRFTVDRTMVRDGGTMTFTLEGSPGSSASLRLLDVAGREVAPVFDGSLAQGTEFVAWSPGALRSGVYLAMARIEGQAIVRRVTVVR